jgi:hypothetical protein
MTDPKDEQEATAAGTEGRRSDATFWAAPKAALTVGDVPTGATNLNVDGRRLVGPLQGFGQLWQKTYRIRLVGPTIAPGDVIREWKATYSRFWPKGNRLYTPAITPGAVALINAESVGRVHVATGIRVIYSDAESFAFMNAAGHPAAGMLTFSADRQDDVTRAQVQVLIRANDPSTT